MKMLLLLPLLFICSCQAEKEETKKNEKKVSPKVEEAVAVIMKTSMGEITIELNGEKAPITVGNFLEYVDAKFYDATVFHRVINGFMIQGGGFELKNKIPTEKTNNPPIKNEGQNGLKNDRGTIAMARTNDIDSATSQFYINVSDNAALNYPSNGGYAVFGKVIKGMDVVDEIKSIKTARKYLNSRSANGRIVSGASSDVPVEPITIISIRRAK